MYKFELQTQTVIHNSKHTTYLIKLQFEELLLNASVPYLCIDKICTLLNNSYWTIHSHVLIKICVCY